MTDETTILPTPVTAPDPAPGEGSVPPAPAVPPAGTPQPRGRRGRRGAGIAGQVVGVIGIVVSLALVVGVLVGRGWVLEQVDAVASTLDSGVARAIPLVDTTRARIGDVSARIGEAAAAAEGVAANPGAGAEAIQGVLSGLSSLSERYLELRATYTDAREDVVSALDRLEALSRIVPGISVPEGPVQALAALDERARSLDAGIMSVIEAGAAVGSVTDIAEAIASRARDAEALLGGVTSALDDVAARLATLQAEIAELAATISTATTIVAIVLVALLLYVAFLHLVLFRSGRRLARDPAGA